MRPQRPSIETRFTPARPRRSRHARTVRLFFARAARPQKHRRPSGQMPGQFSSYFLRMPVSVLLRLFTALFAAGVFTAGEEDDSVCEPLCFTPKLFPVVPWFKALEVLEPGDPPVPLSVLPFESVLPTAPPAPLEPAAPPPPDPALPPAPCACADERLASRRPRIMANCFMRVPCLWQLPISAAFYCSLLTRRMERSKL